MQQSAKLVACAAMVASATATGGSKGSMVFSELKNTTTPDLVVSHAETVTINDGEPRPLVLSKIGASGDEIDGVVFGALLNNKNEPLPNIDGTSGNQVSNDPDFTSILYPQDKSGAIFSLTHFERPNPGIAYLTHLNHNTEECMLEPTKYVPVNTDDGIWTPCSGSVTPYGTHIGSEEYEPDAREYERLLNAEDVDGLLTFGYGASALQMQYFGFDPENNIPTIEDWNTTFFPYKYGHNWEFKVLDSEGNFDLKKTYATGRIAFEMCLLSPDSKTMYCTDDGSNVGFFRFDAAEAENLEGGTLSCAKYDQTSAEEGGEFTVSWIELGSVTNAQEELEPLAESLKFSDIFEEGVYDAETQTCPEGFSVVQVASKDVECLKLRESEGAAQHAAFFETRRYCSMMGGTVEFAKWEGITYDDETSTFYTAMSAVYRGMEDNEPEYDTHTGNAIALAQNGCGCVYALTTVGGETAFDITGMKAEVCGTPIDEDDNGNTCALDGIANPDNVVMIHGYNELMIAEDSGKHTHNYLWSYNLGTKALTRIASVPLGSEVTGPTGFRFEDVQGCDYFLLVNQHPDTGRAAVHFLSAKAQEVSTEEPTEEPAEESTEEESGISATGEVVLIFAIFILFSGFFMFGMKTKSREETLVASSV